MFPLLSVRRRFDLLANGGASLTLSFERAPFLVQYRTVWLPWNVFYVMDTLVMKKASGGAAEIPASSRAGLKKWRCWWAESVTPVLSASGGERHPQL